MKYEKFSFSLPLTFTIVRVRSQTSLSLKSSAMHVISLFLLIFFFSLFGTLYVVIHVTLSLSFHSPFQAQSSLLFRWGLSNNDVATSGRHRDHPLQRPLPRLTSVLLRSIQVTMFSPYFQFVFVTHYPFESHISWLQSLSLLISKCF